MTNGVGHDPQPKVTAIPQLGVGHRHCSRVMKSHHFDEECIEGRGRGIAKLLNLRRSEKSGHRGPLLGGTHPHRQSEPACPPFLDYLVLSALARSHEIGEPAQMRVAGFLRSDRSQFDSLIMMRGHVPHESLVERGIAP